MQTRFVAAHLIASLLLAGCASAPVEVEERSSAANAMAEPAKEGVNGRDGYLELQRVEGATDPDKRYELVARTPDGNEKVVLRHGEWITAIIPADIATELASGGELTATIYLVYTGGGSETNRDERAFEAQPDGSFTAPSFTIPGDAEAKILPNTLSARLVTTRDNKFAASPTTELSIARAKK